MKVAIYGHFFNENTTKYVEELVQMEKADFSVKLLEQYCNWCVKQAIIDYTDILENGKLSRVKNGKSIELNKEDAAKYAESVNSVIYFVTLPYKLKDAAVIASEMPETTIQNKSSEKFFY